MLNNYEILGDTVAITLKGATYGRMITLISLDKLDRAKEFPSSWCAVYNKNSRTFYVMGVAEIDGKRKSFLLHRWISDYNGPLFVDHINHNTLDNRDLNLRLLNHAQNAQNLNPDKFVRVRGVSWNSKRKKWVAQLIVNGKHVYNKRFDKYIDAVDAITEERAKYMPYSPEATAANR